MKHLCAQLLSMLSLASFLKMYPWIRGRQGATLMNGSYRKISYTVLWWPSSSFMKDRSKVPLPVSSCAWMSCRKEVENYYRCSLWSLCKIFGEIKTAKTTMCPDLQFWCLKELSVFQNCPILHVLRSFCSEGYGGFTAAFWLQRSSCPCISVCSSTSCPDCEFPGVSECVPALFW